MSNIPEYHYIKGIDRIVREKLKELNLTPKLPLSSFKKKKKRFYSSPCKEKVFFKMLLVEEDWVGRLLKREAIATKVLTNRPILIFRDLFLLILKTCPIGLSTSTCPGPWSAISTKYINKGEKKRL